MTMNTEQMIKVMKAFQEGEKIEHRRNGHTELEWVDVSNPCWDWYRNEYRIKEKSKPSIDWSHVNPKYICLFQCDSDFYVLSETIPTLSVIRWTLYGNCIPANVFASFKPGNCDWKDSLVIRA